MTFDTGLDPYYVHPDDFQVCFQSRHAVPGRRRATGEPRVAPRLLRTTTRRSLRPAGASVRGEPLRRRAASCP